MPLNFNGTANSGAVTDVVPMLGTFTGPFTVVLDLPASSVLAAMNNANGFFHTLFTLQDRTYATLRPRGSGDWWLEQNNDFHVWTYNGSTIATVAQLSGIAGTTELRCLLENAGLTSGNSVRALIVRRDTGAVVYEGAISPTWSFGTVNLGTTLSILRATAGTQTWPAGTVLNRVALLRGAPRAGAARAANLTLADADVAWLAECNEGSGAQTLLYAGPAAPANAPDIPLYLAGHTWSGAAAPAPATAVTPSQARATGTVLDVTVASSTGLTAVRVGAQVCTAFSIVNGTTVRATTAGAPTGRVQVQGAGGAWSNGGPLLTVVPVGDRARFVATTLPDVLEAEVLVTPPIEAEWGSLDPQGQFVRDVLDNGRVAPLVLPGGTLQSGTTNRTTTAGRWQFDDWIFAAAAGGGASPTGTLPLVFTTPRGAPLAGARVRLTSDDPSLCTVPGEVVTGSDGRVDVPLTRGQGPGPGIAPVRVQLGPITLAIPVPVPAL